MQNLETLRRTFVFNFKLCQERLESLNRDFVYLKDAYLNIILFEHDLEAGIPYVVKYDSSKILKKGYILTIEDFHVDTNSLIVDIKGDDADIRSANIPLDDFKILVGLSSQ